MLHRGVLGGFDASRPPETGRQRLGAMLEKRRVMIAIGAALALFIGLSLGLLGGGGSILTVPILVYVVKLPAHEAIATSLLVVGTTSAAAVISHARAGRVMWRTGVVFGVAGMVGAFGAGRFAKLIPASVLLGLFGAMMLVTAVAMLRGRKKTAGAPAGERRELPLGKVLAEGLIVGAVTGLVGAGGGFLVVPALVLLGGLSMEVAVGTSLVVITLKSFAGFLGYLGSTPVQWDVAGYVTAAAVVGSFLGGRLAGRFAPEVLRQGFAWFVVAMATFILGQEIPRALDVEPPMLWVLAGTALGVGVVAGLGQLLRHLGVVGRDEPPAVTVGHGST
jgi:uncharacterized membrane protein YfcA